METKEFTPQLIGINHDAIEREINNLDLVVSRLNSFKLAWENYFKERVSIPIIQLVFSTKPKLITRMIQVRYLELDTELSGLAKNNRIKIDKLIELTDFPDFSDLKEEIVSIRMETDRMFNSQVPYLKEIFDGKKFKIPEDLINKISEKNTYYTKNTTENLMLEKIQALCANLNFFNNCGANISARDLPNNIASNVTTIRGERKNNQLKLAASGEPNWYTPKFIPYWSMFERENTLFDKVVANLDLLEDKKAAQ